jgi:RNA polymerase sigma-70 factor (ECF subfamily)
MRTISEFETKLYSNQKALETYAYRLTQGVEAAKDLFQETAFSVMKNRELYRVDINFKAWVFTIMKNTFINDYRKKSKMRMINDTTDNLYHINSRAPAINNMAESNIMIDELRSMVDTLPSKLKLPLELRTQGYKYREIALQLKLPEGTIKSQIFFARKILIKLWAAKYPQFKRA